MSASSHAAALPLVLLGAGGHAKVLLGLARAAGHVVVGVCDPAFQREQGGMWSGIPVLGGDEALEAVNPQSHALVNAIGPLPGRDARRRLYERYREMGFVFPALVHPFSWVDASVDLADGVQVMAGAVIQPDCTIGANTTINTRASVDHDCRVEAHVHIAPGATLCGGVSVAHGAYIGAGATIIQGLRVGGEAIVGAGTTCVRSVEAGAVVLGASARARPRS